MLNQSFQRIDWYIIQSEALKIIWIFSLKVKNFNENDNDVQFMLSVITK